MIEDDEDTNSVIFSSLRLETSFVRCIDSTVLPATLKIQVDFAPGFIAQTIEGTKAIMKIRYWVDNIFKHSIAMSSLNTDLFQMLYTSGIGRANNNLVMTPGDPSDPVLAMVLQAKFEALSEIAECINNIEVKSDNALGLVTTFIGEPSDALPTMQQWIGDRSYFDRPWWDRDDVSTYDMAPAADADLTKRPAYAGKIIMPMFDEIDGGEDESEAPDDLGSTIIRPKFRPRVIDGDGPPDA